jgi:DNA-binding PadR family transcriptional regulator
MVRRTLAGRPQRVMAQPLGDLELLVLLAVLRRGDAAYAVSVRDEIVTRTRRDVSRGAVYVTLDRLERKGCLQSRLGEPTAERGGKAKRLFALTPDGRASIRGAIEDTRSMVDGLPADALAPRAR